MENQLLDSEMLENKEGKSLSSLLTNGYETNSVEYIKKGFELFKQDIGPFILFVILFIVAEMILSSIPFVKGFTGPLLAPVLAGGFIVAKMIDKKEPHSPSNFLDGTKKYTPLFLVALIPTLIAAVVFLVFGGWAYFKMTFLGIMPEFAGRRFSFSNYAGYAGRGGLAGLIAMVIAVLFLLSNFLVLFENFEPVKALQISAKIVSKKFFNWFGFIVLLGLFNLAGMICLGVGLLVTIPSTLCALYVAYEDVVGLNLRD